MRPIVVAAVLLLVELMSMSASADWYLGEKCRTEYPATPCSKNIGETGWYQFGPDRCLKVFSSLTKGHSDAKFACRRFPKGDLVSIHTRVERSQVECAMYSATPDIWRYWIGLYRKGNEFVWTDGSKHDFSFWAMYEPNNYGGREHCVEMTYSEWNDDACGKLKPYVCQVTI